MTQLLKTTLVIHVEAMHTLETVHLVGPLVVEGLRELLAKAPTDQEGKIETEGGLDISWASMCEKVDVNGNPLLAFNPIALAVNHAAGA